MHAIHWFEIPVIDLDRATRFYGALLASALRREIFGGTPIAIFPYEPKQGVGGCLLRHPTRRPSSDGPIVYLATADLDSALARLPNAGGELVMARTDIGEPGFIAMIRDTEGNVVGLHQPR